MFWLSSQLAEFNVSYVASELIIKMAHSSEPRRRRAYRSRCPNDATQCAVKKNKAASQWCPHQSLLGSSRGDGRQTRQLPGCFFLKWWATLTGNFLKGAFQKQLVTDELFGRYLVSPMHLDETTDEAELTEVVSVGPSDSCSVGALYLAAARVCSVVMVQSGRSIPKTLSARIDFLFLDPWKRSCNTADPPSCVTLSFWDTDQSEDELEITGWWPWTLRWWWRWGGGGALKKGSGWWVNRSSKIDQKRKKNGIKCCKNCV